MQQIYAIEWNGDCWQSVFPSSEAEKSQLHTTAIEAMQYMLNECGLSIFDVQIINKA